MLDPTQNTPAKTGLASPAAILAANAYLARYTGATLRTYTVSLKVLFDWLARYGLDPLDVRRPHLELFVREHLEQERHLSPSSVNHHWTAVAGYYRFAVIDDVIAKDPSVAVRLPKMLRDPYRTDFLNAAELRAVLAAARRSERPSDQGLIALLAILGLRIAEALQVQVEDYRGTIDGHRVLRLIGKGAKPATLPLTVATLRMLNVAAGDRTEGPLLLRDRSSVHARVGLPLTYRAARLGLQRLASDAGIDRRITPHMFRRGVITHGLDQGVPLRDMQILARHSDPRTTSLYDRGALNLDRSAVHIVSASLAGAA